MHGIDEGRAFLEQYGDSRLVVAPHPDADGLAGAALLWRTVLKGDCKIACPEKGYSIHTPEFQDKLRELDPAALIVIDQGARQGAVLPGVPTLTIDHHATEERPEGVYVTSYPGHPTESAAHLCYVLAGEPDGLLWLAAIGEIGDYGIKAPFDLVREARTRYTQVALLESIALINAARRSSRFDWSMAFDMLLEAENPRQIAALALPGSEALQADREEVTRELHRAKKSHPFFADPWAVIPFSSQALVHGLLANTWINRLKAHYVLAANFGYRPGYVHFSLRSALLIDLMQELIDVAPADMPGEWGHGHPGATGGAVTRNDFLVLLNRLGFTPEQTLQIEDAARVPR